ncbi:MAG: hypothetical protein ABL967_14815 [Bryobacteraceae bacterium]
MGSNPTQAIGILLFFAAFVLLGLAFAGGGIMALIGAAVLMAASVFFFLKCKPWENQSEESSSSLSVATGEVKG